MYEKRLGKCAVSLISMIDDFPDHIKDLPFAFYFDNLFTGFPLLLHLRERGYSRTGTMRENQIPNSCPIPYKKQLEKKPRGYFDSQKMIDEDIRLTIDAFSNSLVENSSVFLSPFVFAALISAATCLSRSSKVFIF